jgi:membrane-bound ClpP family serine protease
MSTLTAVTSIPRKIQQTYVSNIQSPLSEKIEELFFKKPAKQNILEKVWNPFFGPTIICIGCIALIFSIFSIYTIISLSIIGLGLNIVMFRLKYFIERKGLLHYFPIKWKRILLSRS